MVWTSRPVRRLAGSIRAPGDKSCSHRALIFGGLASGVSRFTGLLEGDDVIRTGLAMAALGAEVACTGPGAWEVRGVGAKGLASPKDVLDFGNSGTGSRLMMGVMAGFDLTAALTGDASLSSRPHFSGPRRRLPNLHQHRPQQQGKRMLLFHCHLYRFSSCDLFCFLREHSRYQKSRVAA